MDTGTAAAEAAPAGAAGLCETSRFDPDTGLCVHEPAEDGAPCSNHCVSDGACLDGACRGANDGCDDGNPCTRDLVASDCTCQHERYPDRSTGVCSKETCVDGVGWKPDNADDGTACGPVNECTGQFCTGGVCGPPADAPEGTICRAGTPCQQPSRCRRLDGTMQCSPAAGHPSTTLAPVWSVSPVAGKTIHYEGVSDEGYVYWVECGGDGCGLRSIVTIVDKGEVGGTQPDPSQYFYIPIDRFDDEADALATMFTGEVAQNGGLLLSRGRLFSTYRAGWLEAYDYDTGDAVFRLDLSSDGSPVGRGGTAVNAHGDVVLLLADAAGVPRTVVAVTPAGILSWARVREGIVRGLVADEVGNVYFAEETLARSTLVSLDGSGQERFTVDAGPRAPLAAFNGRLLHGDGTLYDTLGGKVIGGLPLLVPDLALPPVLDETAGWLAGYPVGESGPDWTAFSLQRFAPVSAEAQLALPLSRLSAPWDRSEPLLLDQGSVILAEGRAAQSCTTPPVLKEWTRALDTTEPAWSCPLAPGSYGGPATVLGSLWIAQDGCRGTVEAFLLEVAGQHMRRLAAAGWIGGGGEPGRSNRPLR